VSGIGIFGMFEIMLTVYSVAGHSYFVNLLFDVPVYQDKKNE